MVWSSENCTLLDLSLITQGVVLRVEWNGALYAATVVSVSTSKKRSKAPVKVHYSGHSAQYDEWVGVERLRSRLLVAASRAQAKSEESPPPPQRSLATRSFCVPQAVIDACATDDGQAARRKSQSPINGDGCPSARRAIVSATAKQTRVNLGLWVFYRDWVDRYITRQTCSDLSFHRFVCVRALTLDHVVCKDVLGGDAACVMATLASAGLLGAGDSEVVLQQWLVATLDVFDRRFLMAQDRIHQQLRREDEGIWKGTYDFVQLADPQFGMLHRDQGWLEEESMLRLAVQHVNRLKPRFLLISGDLINAFPSGPGAAPEEASREIAAFKTALGNLDPSIPLVVQPGNHDVAQVPRPEDVQHYMEHFGDDYFSFWVGGVFYVSINSQYYMDARHTEHLRTAQDRWIKAELAKVKGQAKHIVVLSHVPPFVADEDEDQGWATWERGCRRRILAQVAEAGAILWLCGHFHGNAVARSRAGVEVVVTSSCGSVINWKLPAGKVATLSRPDFKTCVNSPSVIADAQHSGLRIIRVREDGAEHRWFTLSDVPDSLDNAFLPETSSHVMDNIDRQNSRLGQSPRTRAWSSPP